MENSKYHVKNFSTELLARDSLWLQQNGKLHWWQRKASYFGALLWQAFYKDRK